MERWAWSVSVARARHAAVTDVDFALSVAKSKIREHFCPCRDLGRYRAVCDLAVLFLHLLATVALQPTTDAMHL